MTMVHIGGEEGVVQELVQELESWGAVVVEEGVEPDDGGRWRSCDGCPRRVSGGEELVMHRDAWDRVKRVSSPKAIAFELENARHRGNWVSVRYAFDVCEFDNNPTMPKGIKHNCPHYKLIDNARQKEWWE